MLQADILLEFGQYPFLRLWRQNTGMAYGVSLVKEASGHLFSGNLERAMKAMRSMVPTRYGVPGTADIMGIFRGGRSLAIECKLYGEQPSEEQVNWRAMFEDYGGLYILANQVMDVYQGLVSGMC